MIDYLLKKEHCKMSTRIVKLTVVLIGKKCNKTLYRNETETNAF